MVIEWGSGDWIAHYDLGGIIFSLVNGEYCEYLYLISQYTGYQYTYKKIEQFLSSDKTQINLGHCEINCSKKEYKEELKKVITRWLEYFYHYVDCFNCFKRFCNGDIDNIEMHEEISKYDVAIHI